MDRLRFFGPVAIRRLSSGFNQFMGLDIDRMQTLWSLDDFEAYRLPGLQCTIAFHLNC